MCFTILLSVGLYNSLKYFYFHYYSSYYNTVGRRYTQNVLINKRRTSVGVLQIFHTNVKRKYKYFLSNAPFENIKFVFIRCRFIKIINVLYKIKNNTRI